MTSPQFTTNLQFVHTAGNPCPPGGKVFPLVTPDGLTLRAASWTIPDSCGSVLIFPGRTEHIEIYFETVAFLRTLGWSAAVLDWRGVGKSPRTLIDRRKGHVKSFAEYQLDATSFVNAGPVLSMPKPWILLAHSMGGAIALRFIVEHPDLFAGGIFSAPMFGLGLGKYGNWLARNFACIANGLGFSTRYAFGCNCRSAADIGFDGNLLTSSREQFGHLQELEAVDPELALGGVTWGWLRAAYREIRALQKIDCPFLPKLVLVGEYEQVVDTASIRRFVLGAPSTHLHVIPNCWHNLLTEARIPSLAVRETISTFLFRRRAEFEQGNSATAKRSHRPYVGTATPQSQLPKQ